MSHPRKSERNDITAVTTITQFGSHTSLQLDLDDFDAGGRRTAEGSGEEITDLVTTTTPLDAVEVVVMRPEEITIIGSIPGIIGWGRG